MTWTAPTPPLQDVWWDLAATKAAVLAKLRLLGTDIDAPRIEALVPVAGRLINRRLDRTVASTAEEIAVNKVALEDLVIALYTPRPRNPDGSFVDPLDSLELAGRQRRGIA